MSKETISEIQRVEEDAGLICENARTEAKKRVDEARTAAEQIIAEANENAAAERRDRLEKCHAEAEKIIEQGKIDAQKDMTDMFERAELHTKNAIKILLWGISDKCQ